MVLAPGVSGRGGTSSWLEHGSFGMGPCLGLMKITWGYGWIKLLDVSKVSLEHTSDYHLTMVYGS